MTLNALIIDIVTLLILVISILSFITIAVNEEASLSNIAEINVVLLTIVYSINQLRIKPE